jgi:hypothetical protein
MNPDLAALVLIWQAPDSWSCMAAMKGSPLDSELRRVYCERARKQGRYPGEITSNSSSLKNGWELCFLRRGSGKLRKSGVTKFRHVSHFRDPTVLRTDTSDQRGRIVASSTGEMSHGTNLGAATMAWQLRAWKESVNKYRNKLLKSGLLLSSS